MTAVVKRLARFAVLLVFPALIACTDSGGLIVSHAWVRAMPPSSGMTAGYFTVTNSGDNAVVLTGASCDSFADVSLHETVTTNGMSRMQAMDSVHIPASSELAFAPGGRHLMLMQPLSDISEGHTVSLTLHFANSADITVSAPVTRGP